MQRGWQTCLTVAALLGGVALSSCSSAKPAPPKRQPARAPTPACLAAQIEKLTTTTTMNRACLLEHNSCPDMCRDGVADACLVEAFRLQATPSADQAGPLFARACALDLAIGCTNYGADLWLVHQPASPADELCARRLFEKACEAREPVGCGLVGRMMAANARTPSEREAARTHFDSACNVFGGVSCRMYALHLEKGQLGSAKPETVRALMMRACETGDSDACNHATAGETFGTP